MAHDPQAFISDIEEFIKQVHEVDHLNLFLAQVGYALRGLGLDFLLNVTSVDHRNLLLRLTISVTI